MRRFLPNTPLFSEWDCRLHRYSHRCSHRHRHRHRQLQLHLQALLTFSPIYRYFVWHTILCLICVGGTRIWDFTQKTIFSGYFWLFIKQTRCHSSGWEPAKLSMRDSPFGELQSKLRVGPTSFKFKFPKKLFNNKETKIAYRKFYKWVHVRINAGWRPWRVPVPRFSGWSRLSHASTCNI